MSAVQPYSIKGRKDEGGENDAFMTEEGNLFCRIDMHLSVSP